MKNAFMILRMKKGVTTSFMDMLMVLEIGYVMHWIAAV
jgi:hypothetical protein